MEEANTAELDVVFYIAKGWEEKKHTLSVNGRKSRWLFAFRTTTLFVGGGILPTLSKFILEMNKKNDHVDHQLNDIAS